VLKGSDGPLQTWLLGLDCAHTAYGLVAVCGIL